MKAIMLMFDSLNRRFLPPYGCDHVIAPNFQRLADRAVTFDNCYVGSMPCMPARRELHTGRYNFLHRSWGPLEPFDDSAPELLKNSGVYTHLASDHYHYWEEGGCTYHTRYSSWEISRGQEGDPWKGQVRDPEIPEHLGQAWRQDVVNRQYLTDEAAQPQAVTFARGMEFLRNNHREDNWLLHMETFDPHEPFFTQQKYKDLYPHDYTGPQFDWPAYRRVEQEPHQVAYCRHNYAALVSMCDAYLGRVLALMDELGLWDDTMLIVNTDHGFLLGEHDWWAKCAQPFYNEVAHAPLFIWDPRSRRQGERRQALVQTIDLPATLLEAFGVERPPDMQGVPLAETIASVRPARRARQLHRRTLRLHARPGPPGQHAPVRVHAHAHAHAAHVRRRRIAGHPTGRAVRLHEGLPCDEDRRPALGRRAQLRDHAVRSPGRPPAGPTHPGSDCRKDDDRPHGRPHAQ